MVVTPLRVFSTFEVPHSFRPLTFSRPAVSRLAGRHNTYSSNTMSSADTGGEGASGVGEGGSILLNQPIVLDNGTASIKAGFAGGSKPKVR
jgi:hypothetical protein